MTIKKRFVLPTLLFSATQLVGCGGSDSDDNDTAMPRLVSAVTEGAEVITDNETGLKWVNDIQFCFAGVTKPEDSNCDSLNTMEAGGITNWRLPNSAEMSELIIQADADENITLNYINASCAVMTASDGWVFTENSNAPGTLSQVEPGNAGVRCVAGESAAPTQRLRTIFTSNGSTELLRDAETELTWVNDIQFCFAGVTETNAANCDTLNTMAVGGLTDWRSPNTVEMSGLINAVVADEDVTLNYINPSCAVMTTSDGWVFTENSNSPGMTSQVQPGNAGLRCVSPTMPADS